MQAERIARFILVKFSIVRKRRQLFLLSLFNSTMVFHRSENFATVCPSQRVQTQVLFKRARAMRAKTSNLYGFSCLAILLISIGTGCHLRPNFWSPPGDAETQQSRAVVHDPFPDNEAGPSLYGNRPSGFTTPWSESRRSQMTTPNRNTPTTFGY